MAKSKTTSPKLVGVLHCPALPGAPQNRLSLAEIEKRVLAEAAMLEVSGFDALILENFGDVPFYKDKVPAITLSAMSILAQALTSRLEIPLGINVLRNDAHGALAIAVNTGARFIRVNVLSGLFATDQGLIEGSAHTLVRERESWARKGSRVEIWADVLVKHARCLSQEDPAHAAEELVLRAGADALILTGPTTGRAVEMGSFEEVSRLGLNVPIYLGSGTRPENLKNFVSAHSDLRVIVGSALRKNGKAGETLDKSRVKNYVKNFKALL